MAGVDLRAVNILVDKDTLKLTFQLGGDVVPQDTADDSGAVDVSATLHYSEEGLYFIEVRPGSASPLQLNILNNDPPTNAKGAQVESSGIVNYGGTNIEATIPRADLPHLGNSFWWYADSQMPPPNLSNLARFDYGDFCASLDAPTRFPQK